MPHRPVDRYYGSQVGTEAAFSFQPKESGSGPESTLFPRSSILVWLSALVLDSRFVGFEAKVDD